MTNARNDANPQVEAVLVAALELDPTVTRDAVARYVGEIAAMAADIAPYRVDAHVPVREFAATWREDAQPS